MIAETMTFLSQQLDDQLRPRFGVGQPVVQLSPPAPRTADASQAEEGVHLTLINLEREGIAANTSKTSHRAGEEFVASRQPLNLNLVFMASVHFPGAYQKSLNVLSAVISHFQMMPVATPQTAPGLPSGISRLSVEWRDMDLSSMHNLWSALGSDYLPSAIYMARMIVVNDLSQATPQSMITSIGLEDD